MSSRPWQPGLRLSGTSLLLQHQHEAITRLAWTLITLNGLVLGAWYHALGRHDSGRLEKSLERHFVLSRKNLRAGRYWTVLTSAFSHKTVEHFSTNMFTLHSFLNTIALIPGLDVMTCSLLLLGSALAGSAAWYQHERIREKKRTSRNFLQTAASGASGMTMGLGAAVSCLAPMTMATSPFLPVQVPLWAYTAGYFVLDAYYLDDVAGKVGHSAHIGGAVFGAMFYFLRLRDLGGVWKMLQSVRSARTGRAH